MKFLNLILFVFVRFSYQHSWLECTDYRIENENDKNYYNDAKCFGYARGGQRQHEAGFGVDTGFDFRDQSRCQSTDMNSYNDFTPRAVYTQGQRVCLAYPPKNHVAETCTNRFIPDQGVNIIRSNIQNSDDFNGAKFYPHLNGEHVKGQIDFKGFQNCPKFCENMDKALCTMCFDLEPNTPTGVYTFKWTWEFNPGEFYYACWDAEIKPSNGQQPTVSPVPVPPPSPSPPPAPRPPNCKASPKPTPPPTLPPCPVIEF